VSSEKTLSLRAALGKFATGVTIVTAADREGDPVGVTANSFSSISLEPPLVMWALDKRSLSLSAFGDSEHYCVHVLTSEQRSLSQRFATQGADKFDSVTWAKAPHDTPHLADFLARFCCRVTRTLDIGDHIVYVGQVVDFEMGTEQRPLLYFAGQYAHADRRWELGSAEGPERRENQGVRAQNDDVSGINDENSVIAHEDTVDCAAKNQVERTVTFKGFLWAALGIVIGLSLLHAAFHRADIPALKAILAETSLVLPILVLVSAMSFMFLKVWRWQLLLAIRNKTSIRDLVEATFVGVAVNFLLSHAGDVFRTAMVSSSQKIHFSKVLASVFVERALDFVALLCIIALGLIVDPRLPDFVILAGAICGAFVLLAILLAYYVLNTPGWLLALANRVASRLPSRVAAWVRHQFELLRDGLMPAKQGHLVVATSIVSVVQWVMIAVAIWLSFEAVGVAPTPAATVVTMVLLVVGLSLPSAPMQLGTTQMAFMLGMAVDHVDTTLAIAASIVYMGFLVVPMMLLGGILFLLRRQPAERSKVSPRQRSTTARATTRTSFR